MDVLEFWRANKYKFPLLAQAAKKWLCVPASSAPSERAFSAGGGIVSYKRTKLQPEQVEKLLYIQQNYPKVQIKRWLLTSQDEKEEFFEEASTNDSQNSAASSQGPPTSTLTSTVEMDD